MCCCCYRFPCGMFYCRHGLIDILLPALLSWLPLVACFVQDHVFLSSGFLLLKNLTQFDQAHILLSLWLPDCRCFNLIIKSMYCCRHCLHSCHWFKITGTNGCGSPARLLGTVPLPLALFLVPLFFGNSQSLVHVCCRHGFPTCHWLTFTFKSMY